MLACMRVKAPVRGGAEALLDDIDRRGIERFVGAFEGGNHRGERGYRFLGHGGDVLVGGGLLQAVLGLAEQVGDVGAAPWGCRPACSSAA